jgi:tetratricopeptide (TPR) repeat protein
MSRLKIVMGVPGGATSWAETAEALVGNRAVQTDETARSWPFRRFVVPAHSAGEPEAVVIKSLHDAFPTGQTGAARLVLTQSTYQLQRWIDWLDANPSAVAVGVLSNPSRDLMRDAGARRGPWARLDVVEVALASTPDPAGDPLHDAFRQTDPETRYRACRSAAAESPSDPALALALGSACMETGRLDECDETLAAAAAGAGDWEAVHYEQGKAWLRRDNTARAAAAFAEAARLMPTFAAAHANLGAALGELERPQEALAALEHAARLDPFGHATHNNIGASLRDLGRLQEAESSFQRVIALAPSFVFGHYNLGHVLFLQGRFADARNAYEAGLTRDPAQTPWQRVRLALTLAGLDDEPSAQAHARAALDATPDEGRDDLLDEMVEVLEALTALHGERRQAIRALERVVADYRSAIPRS